MHHIGLDHQICAPAGKLIPEGELPGRQPELSRDPDDLLGNIHGHFFFSPNSVLCHAGFAFYQRGAWVAAERRRGGA